MRSSSPPINAKRGAPRPACECTTDSSRAARAGLTVQFQRRIVAQGGGYGRHEGAGLVEGGDTTYRPR